MVLYDMPRYFMICLKMYNRSTLGHTCNGSIWDETPLLIHNCYHNIGYEAHEVDKCMKAMMCQLVILASFTYCPAPFIPARHCR